MLSNVDCALMLTVTSNRLKKINYLQYTVLSGLVLSVSKRARYPREADVAIMVATSPPPPQIWPKECAQLYSPVRVIGRGGFAEGKKLF